MLLTELARADEKVGEGDCCLCREILRAELDLSVRTGARERDLFALDSERLEAADMLSSAGLATCGISISAGRLRACRMGGLDCDLSTFAETGEAG